MAVRYRRPVCRAPKNDPQRERLYRMENENIGAKGYTRLSRKMVDKLTRAICRAFKVPPVVVRYKDLGQWAAEWRAPNILTFGDKSGSRSAVAVAHEMAHHIHNAYACEAVDKQEAHGPEFMCIYMAVLDRCRIIPAISMRPLCERYRVQYVDPGDLEKELSVSRLAALVKS